MKKFLSLIALSLFLNSCTSEPITAQNAPLVNQNLTSQINTESQINNFTVKWASNQEGSIVELKKYVFKDCKVVSTEVKEYTENEFDITLKTGQKFDIQILHTAPVKNPELYLSIYKNNRLQYEQEINTNGFMLISFVDANGNISQ